MNQSGQHNAITPLELADRCLQAVRSFNVTFGPNPIGLHAAIDALILAGGLFTGQQVHILFGTQERFTHTCPAIDCELWFTDKNWHVVEEFKHGGVMIRMESCAAQRGPQLPLIRILMLDEAARNLLIRGIQDYEHRYAAKKHLNKDGLKNLAWNTQGFGIERNATAVPPHDPELFKDLANRLTDFLGQLKDIQLLTRHSKMLQRSAKPSKSVSKVVPSVWLMCVLPGARKLEIGVPESLMLSYRLALVPSEEQRMLLAKLGGKRFPEPWMFPTGDEARSLADSAVGSGFVSVGYPWLADPRGTYGQGVSAEDKARGAAIAGAMADLFAGTKAFDFVVPLHVTGVPMFALRFQIPMAEKHEALHIYQCLVPSLAAQLRQIMTASYLSRMRAAKRDYQDVRKEPPPDQDKLSVLDEDLQRIARHYPFPYRKRIGNQLQFATEDRSNPFWYRHFTRFEAGLLGVLPEIEQDFSEALNVSETSEDLSYAEKRLAQHLEALSTWDQSSVLNAPTLLLAYGCRNRRAGVLCAIVVRVYLDSQHPINGLHAKRTRLGKAVHGSSINMAETNKTGNVGETWSELAKCPVNKGFVESSWLKFADNEADIKLNASECQWIRDRLTKLAIPQDKWNRYCKELQQPLT